MLDVASTTGYSEITAPYMVKQRCLPAPPTCPSSATIIATGDYPHPTAEVPVTNLYRDRILDSDKLPAARRLQRLLPPRRSWPRAATHGMKAARQRSRWCSSSAGTSSAALRPARRRRGDLRGLGCPTGWCRCAPATCRSPPARSSIWRVFSPATTGGWGSSCSNFGDFRPGGRRSRYRGTDGASRRKNRMLCPHLNGSGLALPPCRDSGAGDLPERRRLQCTRCPRCCNPRQTASCPGKGPAAPEDGRG